MLKDRIIIFQLLCKILSVSRLEFLALDTSSQECRRVGAVIIQNHTTAQRKNRLAVECLWFCLFAGSFLHLWSECLGVRWLICDSWWTARSQAVGNQTHVFSYYRAPPFPPIVNAFAFWSKGFFCVFFFLSATFGFQVGVHILCVA